MNHTMNQAAENAIGNDDKRYLCIDLKSFYASVECVERGLDPMTARLVVADPERGEGTICLAVSPAMKAIGVRNRCRVFEIPDSIDYIMAPPRMQKYIDYAGKIYGVYLQYISRDDIHVYSIDEAFFDVTPYLKIYDMPAAGIAEMLMDAVRREVGVRAACGVGTNLYLAKIALDICAKHARDFIAELDEPAYRERLWDHRPITDFWRIGSGLARRLASMGIFTMRQLAQMDEELLYERFGIDAELLIDHAWGREPVEIADVRQYRPCTSSLTSGQVMLRDYSFEEGKLILREMTEQLCLDMMAKGKMTGSLTLHIGYAKQTGRRSAHGTAKLPLPSNLIAEVWPHVLTRYEEITDPALPIRRFNVSANDLLGDNEGRQLSIMDVISEIGSGAEGAGAYAAADTMECGREKKMQQVMLDIKEKYGKNAMFKGMDLEEAATARARNSQIGGHKSGDARNAVPVVKKKS